MGHVSLVKKHENAHTYPKTVYIREIVMGSCFNYIVISYRVRYIVIEALSKMITQNPQMQSQLSVVQIHCLPAPHMSGCFLTAFSHMFKVLYLCISDIQYHQNITEDLPND